MLQLGAVSSQAREMDLDDIFIVRLKLLLCMARDCLNGCDFSDLRRQVMLENALHIEIESMALGRLDKEYGPDLDDDSFFNFDRFFFNCTKEVCAMIKSYARGVPMDDSQKKVLKKKTEAIICILGTTDHRQFPPSFSEYVLSS